MKAMILAAGKGERMRPLTESCPKPLLTVNNKPLIIYLIEKLKNAGIAEIVINISYLGNMVEECLGDGSAYGVNIQYSRETEPLETGGGISKALPLLCDSGENPFLLVNADIWCDYNFSVLVDILPANKLAHLVLVENPDHNKNGDFFLDGHIVKSKNTDSKKAVNGGYTFSGISVIDPGLFKDFPVTGDRFPLRDLLQKAIEKGKVQGEYYEGSWLDIGTPERLEEVRRKCQQ